MKVLTYELLALEPLLISRPDSDANSAISYAYVPGSVIRGVLANRYLADADCDLADDDDARRLFFEPATRYLNAYPLTGDGARTLPAPLSWRKKKDASLKSGTIIYDVSASVQKQETDDPCEKEQPREQRKALGAYFCAADGVKVNLVKIEPHVNIHTQRERVKGRATKDDGAVFRYHAIPAGTRLGGIVLVENADDVETLQAYLDDTELWLGRSRSGGYGHVRVTFHVQPPEDWWPETPLPDGLNDKDTLVITLLSDAIIRDAEGKYAHTLGAGSLPLPLDLQRAFKRMAVVGSFNRKWGLPGIQAHALQAGSAFVFQATRAISKDELRKFQAKGVGEQRETGFGRIALNWHRRPEFDAIELEVPLQTVSDNDKDSHLTVPSRKLAGQMVSRLLARDLDALVADYAYSVTMSKKWPSNAQLSRLRAIVLNANGETPDVARVLTFLLDDNLQTRARDQYRAARIQAGDGGQPTRLLHWVVDLLVCTLTKAEKAAFLEQHTDARIDGRSVKAWFKEREGRQSAWGKQLEAVEAPVIDGVAAHVTPALQKAYALRLIAGVLHRATKERDHE